MRREARATPNWAMRVPGPQRAAQGAHHPHVIPMRADEEVMHVGRRVYVSNLAWRTSWQDLKDK